MHVYWVLIDLESYNWYQMIAKTILHDHVIHIISYFCCMDVKEIFINKKKKQKKKKKKKTENEGVHKQNRVYLDCQEP